eukprot:2479405-Pyramimonas_sp.AAC.1
MSYVIMRIAYVMPYVMDPYPPLKQVVERHHEKLLREVRVLAIMDGSPYVVKYYWAWIEPR